VNRPLAVSNSSPLIALEQIWQLELLPQLFRQILVPEAVVRETAPTVDLPAWVELRKTTLPDNVAVFPASLGLGETEAIRLAIEVSADWVLLDDRPARRAASGFQLQVVGTIGVLLASKRRALLPALRPCLDLLIQRGFYVAPALYERVLIEIGEL
jgi:predicted nucleic acid-binding protein